MKLFSFLLLIASSLSVNIFAQQSQIWPLEINNYWKYESQYYGGNSYITERKIVESMQISYEDSVIEVFRLADWNGTGWSETGALYANHLDGLWVHGFRLEDGTLIYTDQPFLSLKYPITVGETWMSYRTFGSPEIEFECLSINEQVTVAAGTFNCYKYHCEYLDNDGNTRHDYYYFTPDIGRIFSETLFDDGSWYSKSELLSKTIYTEVDNEETKVQNYELSQNYPNPFNPSTTIAYQLPEKSFVSLIIFDILGREVQVLVNEEQVVGSYKTEIDASNLPSGIYFYKLQAGSFKVTKKMILLK